MRLLGSAGFVMLRAMKLPAVLASLVLAAACGSKTPATTPPTGGDETGSATPVLPDVPFEKLDHDQQIQFMKEQVVPTMAPLFKEHDPKEFAEFGCKNCHGDGAEKGEFEMPNPNLPKLDFADMSKFEKHDIEWMSKVIKPTMAKLLQEAEYSPENPEGFGCMHCHTAAGK
jgi:predicted small lipoprotein YifL